MTSSNPQKTILVIGGTGAQGGSVVRALSSSGLYKILILTRSTNSASAQTLAALPNVSLTTPANGIVYSIPSLLAAMKDVHSIFANTNGFAIGQAKEIYWGMRIYELAVFSGVKHFIWSGLPYASKLGAFDPKFVVGHADGKARVSEFLAAQPSGKNGGMMWSVLTSTMYLETLSELLAPFPDPEDPETMVFSVPVGEGKPPLIALEDLGRYALWMFDNPEKSSGLNLQISTEDVGWGYLAKSFTETTGRKAIFRDVSLDEYFATGVFPKADSKVGYSLADQDDATLLTWRENFTGFWNFWKANLVKTDYKFLDEILPDRIMSVGEWMKKSGYDGKRASVLKDYDDRRKALV